MGVCWGGGGAAGVQAKSNGFSRANSQSNPFGVEPRIGGESLLKKKKIRSIPLRSPFKQNQNRTRESQTVSNIPAARPAGSGISHVTWPQQGGQLSGSFLFFYFLKLRLNLGFSAFFCQRLHWQEPANFRTQISVLIYWCKTGLLVAPSSPRFLSPIPPASVPSFDLRVRPPQYRRRSTWEGGSAPARPGTPRPPPRGRVSWPGSLAGSPPAALFPVPGVR